MLMRTDPFRELDRLTSQVLGSPGRAAMPIDAYRHGDVFVVELDVPGIDPADIELTVEKNVLTVTAERARAGLAEGELLIGERPQGRVSRQLFLGDALDADHLTADCHHGVLTIRVPVAERARPRRVEIGTAAPMKAIDATSTDGAADAPQADAAAVA
jgi:HSP20 family protein